MSLMNFPDRSSSNSEESDSEESVYAIPLDSSSEIDNTTFVSRGEMESQCVFNKLKDKGKHCLKPHVSAKSTYFCLLQRIKYWVSVKGITNGCRPQANITKTNARLRKVANR